MAETNDRNHILDLVKGIGIFLVVFGHITHIPCLREYIWNFHMPLFFFVSGVLFNEKDNFSIHIKKRFKSIIVPYVLFFFITYAYWIILERHTRGSEYPPIHQLLGLLYGTYEGNHLYFNGALWFLPCLFCTDLLFYTTNKLSHNSIVYQIGFLCLGYALGSFCQQNGYTFFPFGLHTALVALTFYGIGFFSKSIIRKAPPKISLDHRLGICFLLCSLVYVQYQCIGIYHGSISKANIPFIMLAIIGIVVTLNISYLIQKNSIIEFLGKNSLIFFVFQEQAYRAILFCMSFILHIPIETLRTNLIGNFTATVITFICIIPLCFLWNQSVKPLIQKV